MERDLAQEPRARVRRVVELSEPLGVEVDEAAEIARVTEHPLSEALHLPFPAVQGLQSLAPDIAPVQENLHPVDPVEGDILRGKPVDSSADASEEGKPVLEDRLLELVPFADLAGKPVEGIGKSGDCHALVSFG